MPKKKAARSKKRKKISGNILVGAVLVVILLLAALVAGVVLRSGGSLSFWGSNEKVTIPGAPENIANEPDIQSANLWDTYAGEVIGEANRLYKNSIFTAALKTDKLPELPAGHYYGIQLIDPLNGASIFLTGVEFDAVTRAHVFGYQTTKDLSRYSHLYVLKIKDGEEAPGIIVAEANFIENEE